MTAIKEHACTMTAIREHQLLLKGPFVNATLAGDKTMTRRPVTTRNSMMAYPRTMDFDFARAIGDSSFRDDDKPGYLHGPAKHCDDPWETNPADDESWTVYPIWRPGERLWIRETWRTYGPLSQCTGPADIMYQSNANEIEIGLFSWRPSIHMPRWACRQLLEITDVWAQNADDITTEDIIAEGFSTTLREHDAVCDLREQWETAWTSIYGPDSLSRWAWVIEYKLIDMEAAA